MNETAPPHSKDIERAVIGAMLIDSDAIKTVIKADNVSLFYYPQHEVIFKALEHLHEHGEPVDRLTLTEQLNRDGSLDDIALPLGIGEYVAVMPGNLIVLAGEPNAGKTAFLLNVTRLNMDRRTVHYFSSEGGVEEHKRRILDFARGKDGVPVEAWKHKFYERSGDFHDVIRPTDVNIVDFLEVHDEFYRIGELLKKIHTKLTTGIVFVAIQKNPGAEHGLGGVRGLERARLYLAMEPGKIVIRKGKVPRKRTVKPDGKTFYFRIVDGCRFVVKG